MSLSSLRFLSFILTVAFCSDSILGIDHWNAHFQRHECNGSCAHRIHGSFGGLTVGLQGSAEGYVNASELDHAISDSLNSGARDIHLFLTVSSVNKATRFASGVTRYGEVEYGPLTIEMHSTSTEVPTEFRLFWDGKAAHPEFFEVGGDWYLGGMLNEPIAYGTGWSRSVQLSCPPLGRHVVQFEVRVQNRLVTSAPVWIEVVAPQKPEVVAVGSSDNGTNPIKPGQIVSVYQDTMVVRFAMPAASEMIMHRPGLEDVKVPAIDECCFAFDLRDLTVGRHALKFSRVLSEGCAMTSEPSDTLWIQYEPTQALHSLRNENAARRRTIVDAVRALSAISGPTFDGTSIYREVNSKFAPIAIEFSASETAESTRPSATGEEAGMGVGRLPEKREGGAPEEASPPGQASPSDQTTPNGVGEPSRPDLPVPDPNASLHEPGQTEALAGRTLWVSTPSGVRVGLGDSPAESASGNDLDPATTLRKRAQRDADLLNKFEDDLALTESVWQANKVVSHVIFDAPAFFPQNGYGTSGEEDARNGLVLLEGMELSTYASGHWELKVPYIKSATPVVLHLRIQFKTADGYWKPLTLQPVCFKAGRPCIDPSDCNCDHSRLAGREQQVKCDCSEDGQPLVTLKGYSPILRREVGYFTDVRRRGSAVFGFGYSALEDRRSF